jgi:ATP-binding cassette subfamily B protein
MIGSFPHFRQLEQFDCGPTCLRMIAKYYGRTFSLETLRNKSYVTREGVSLMGISHAAEAIGLRSIGTRVTLERLEREVPLPCIAHYQEEHFIVVYDVRKDWVHAADPAKGLRKLRKEEFAANWANTPNALGEKEGYLLLLEPSPQFYELPAEGGRRRTWKFFLRYLTPHRRLIGQVILGLGLGSVVAFTFPFMTQAVVDYGINKQNIDFVTLMLVAQLALTISSSFVEYVQAWIFLNVGTRINIALISDFFIKLLKLPLPFFENRTRGDILQRIGDHNRIQSFITGSLLGFLVALLCLLIFSVIMVCYSPTILAIFMAGNALYVSWVLLFMGKRRELDEEAFALNADNQSKIIQMLDGIEDIKLNNNERERRWDWENLQAKSYRLTVRGLGLDQVQSSGSLLINTAKNILISYVAAKTVIEGKMTLGMMLSVQYILGQLQGPIAQFIGFIRASQDAKISLERLNEIHGKDDEENEVEILPIVSTGEHGIRVSGLNFQYEGPHSKYVLKDVDLTIPHDSTTAIVGFSGSGKTTLLKLLLKFYRPESGEIVVGNTNLQHIESSRWRRSCGTVMQTGYVFSDTILGNIVVNRSVPIDFERVIYAATVANIREWIESLPRNYHTKIGADGHGLSQGQKQRILIARAVYKDPDYLFFDEATNALDAENEKVVMANLRRFFRHKTVVIVAHRLSTVRGADQILVLDNGRITERGTHDELVCLRGKYFGLVKEQLAIAG